MKIEKIDVIREVKLIAMYFPQFHVIAENAEWWSAGFTDRDNAARYKSRAIIFRHATRDKFCFLFSGLLHTMQKRLLPKDFIFLNAWNEWSKGTYRERDECYGFGYLVSRSGLRVLEQKSDNFT